jgi:hypothetical protein
MRGRIVQGRNVWGRNVGKRIVLIAKRMYRLSFLDRSETFFSSLYFVFKKYRLSGLKPASPSFSLLVFLFPLFMDFVVFLFRFLLSPVTGCVGRAVPSPPHPHFCASRSLVLKVVCVYSTENLKNFNIFNFQESDKSSNR